MRFGCRGPRRSTASVRTGGHVFAPGAGAPTGRGWVWFCCRSTASVRTGQPQSTSHSSPPSHPGRVLLRFGGGIGFCCRSTAPVRTGQTQIFAPCSPPPSHPGRVLLRFGGGIGYVVGAPPRCEPGEHNPCPTHVPHSHPGRVLLRVGGGIGSVVGAPPRCERGRAQTLLTHTSPCTTSQPRHPLLYSCPDNPLDISKSPIQEAQCRVTSNLPIPPSASWARVRGWQAVPHYRRYPGSRAGFLRAEQRPDSGQYLAYGGAAKRCSDLVLCRDAGSFPLVDAVE